MNESVGGPIGELLNYITQNREEDKCNFFCSKSEIVFIGIVAITVKLLYHERISIEKEQIEREWVKDFFKNINYNAKIMIDKLKTKEYLSEFIRFFNSNEYRKAFDIGEKILNLKSLNYLSL